uniref:AN1-type zinc finger protein 6 n=1 Tax=Hadrurus spadix TaxID=141984 RepID=A0A1W7R950_9SCOR
MERDTNQMSQSSSLCRSGCGFYGSPATDGLCSKCYKDALKRKQSTPPSNVTSCSSPGACSISSSESLTVASTPATDTLLNTAIPTILAASNQEPTNTDISLNSTEIQQEASTSGAIGVSGPSGNENIGTDPTASQDEDQLKDPKKKKNRCTMCRKKVGLTGFECRCGGLFCSAHRYSDEHNCTFDYKGMGAQEIRRNNPLVVGKKVHKI